MNRAIIKALVIMVAVVVLVTSACTLPSSATVQQPEAAPSNTPQPPTAIPPTTVPPTVAPPTVVPPTAPAIEPALQSVVTAEASDGGTVKPPPRTVIIAESGSYSVGGFCTITIEFTGDDVLALVFIDAPLPRPLPDGVHKVAQACRVTYYTSEVTQSRIFPGLFLSQKTPGTYLSQLTPEQGNAVICFAALPKKDMSVFFHNTYAALPVWAQLATTVGEAGACADGRQSGTYVATFTEP